MGRLKFRAIYMAVRRWTDARLSSSSARIREHVLLPLIFLAFPMVLARLNNIAAWPLFAALPVAWIAFFSWRTWRLVRTGSIKSARDYDRRGKFEIPPEYASSESHFAHHRRKRLR